jgi:glycosyltransferase involved in cell wall biosynthesis
VRILYHHRTRAEDAQGVHIDSMVRAFRELGHDVEIVAMGRREVPGSSHPSDPRRPVPTGRQRGIYEAMSLAYNVYGYMRLTRVARSLRPALIYERYALNNFCGILVSRRFGIPLLLEVNAPLAHEERGLATRMLGSFSHSSERWICTHSSRTIAVSRAARALLVEEGVPAEHIVVVPNAIDPERFHPDVDGIPIRRRYGLGDNLVIGFVGWFRDWHGLDLLIDAAARIHVARDDVRFLLIGDGPIYESLIRQVEARGLQSCTIFTGPVGHAEIPAHIASLDIAVQPAANAYACPMKLFEYMAMGRCIVAPDQPNIREVLDNGNAALFHPGDRCDLHAVLTQLIASTEERQALGYRAQQTIFEREYLWTANARRLVALAAEVAGTAAPEP